MQRISTRLQRTTHFLILPFLGAALLLTTPGDCRGSDNSIQGQVRVTNGRPLPSGITVKLEIAENVVVAQQMLGATGKIQVPGSDRQVLCRPSPRVSLRETADFRRRSPRQPGGIS